MSLELLNRSPDIQRLHDAGYFIEILGSLLVMRQVPYVDSQLEVKTGVLISNISMADNKAIRPDPHTVDFIGDYPCNAQGRRLENLINQSETRDLGYGLVVQHMFSNKPEVGYYSDYFEKMVTYYNILSGHANVLKPGFSPRTLALPVEEDDDVFQYIDNASGKAGIGALTQRLSKDKVAIIGLGGSGSYVLDHVAKTPVREIRLFDDDEFLQHNAFRAPGAPAAAELREQPKKVDYFKTIYSRMHKGIKAFPIAITSENTNLLDGISFAFVCIDSGPAKRHISEKLESLGIPFVDVGMGIELDEDRLFGLLRVTASTPEERSRTKALDVFEGEVKNGNLYGSNIQVADLNNLVAVLAVIKWKKMRGFYYDDIKEHQCIYTLDSNMLSNS